MGNNSPKIKRKTFAEVVNSNANANKVLQRHREGIERFFRNNEYLLSKANISVYRQCKEISAKNDFVLERQVIHGLRKGTQLVCSSFILYLVADYWDMDGAEM